MNLPEWAKVVIIGGGVIGTSTAFHLAEAGVSDVVLVEKGDLGSGSTSKAAGGIRLQFSDELNIRIAQRSLAAYERFADRPGGDIDLRQVGYLFLLTEADDVDRFAQSVELQNSLGVPSTMLTPEQALKLCPIAQVDDVMAASFCHLDGHATPEAVVSGYANGARRHGVQILTQCEVIEIESDASNITAVVTAGGRIETDTVVCVAGAWSAQIGAMVGVDLPVTPYRRQIVVSEPLDWLPRDLPLTVDFRSSFYFHREGKGLLMGMGDLDEVPGFNEALDPEWVERLAHEASVRVPGLVDAGVSGGWGGLYEVTPDHNAIIGQAPGCNRFIYATGFSGHGFLQGPAVGEIVRDLVLDHTSVIDVSPLSAQRFLSVGARPEYNVI